MSRLPTPVERAIGDHDDIPVAGGIDRALDRRVVAGHRNCGGEDW